MRPHAMPGTQDPKAPTRRAARERTRSDLLTHHAKHDRPQPPRTMLFCMCTPLLHKLHWHTSCPTCTSELRRAAPRAPASFSRSSPPSPRATRAHTATRTRTTPQPCNMHMQHCTPAQMQTEHTSHLRPASRMPHLPLTMHGPSTTMHPAHPFRDREHSIPRSHTTSTHRPQALVQLKPTHKRYACPASA